MIQEKQERLTKGEVNRVLLSLNIGDLVKVKGNYEGTVTLNHIYNGKCKVKIKDVEKDGISLVDRFDEGCISETRELLESISKKGKGFIFETKPAVPLEQLSDQYIQDNIKSYHKGKHKEYTKFDKMLRRHRL